MERSHPERRQEKAVRIQSPALLWKVSGLARGGARPPDLAARSGPARQRTGPLFCRLIRYVRTGACARHNHQGLCPPDPRDLPLWANSMTGKQENTAGAALSSHLPSVSSCSHAIGPKRKISRARPPRACPIRAYGRHTTCPGAQDAKASTRQSRPHEPFLCQRVCKARMSLLSESRRCRFVVCP